ncbi:MAG: hypothetical protein A2498_09825 [Lentisphaerae bacterium RIFOXYC12_FULL_60_16]|nr:MAG: hypothetical protein A2498_09825 [Lentisphaerae bacterium RIFOXYC12_FULL_60_16]OGV74697.1 MAG: hypothetical protein A2269_07435 [Lentisphaerae bacterium RIFOXYA12_FULL_60_10]OGV84919.1 MAG: hypothetical protein A2340_04645 [Lentisphaerae bacterium RIFOXYB12_FULL_60_10]
MRADLRTVVFAALFGTICAVILTVVGRWAAPHRAANEKGEEMRNYLTALGVPFDAKVSAGDLISVFDRNVRVGTNGNLVLYTYVPEGTTDPEAIAVSFAGMGLWGPVKGVLALEPDLKTIRGLRFYQQEETPGLGGEIGSDWFVGQFKGKRIVDDSDEPGFKLVKQGTTPDRNSVDAITGATMTSDRVQNMLQDLARKVAAERMNRHGRSE